MGSLVTQDEFMKRGGSSERCGEAGCTVSMATKKVVLLAVDGVVGMEGQVAAAVGVVWKRRHLVAAVGMVWC